MSIPHTDNFSPRDTSPVGWHPEKNAAAEAAGLIVARLDREVGCWRLFPAGAQSAAIANGTAKPVLSGDSCDANFRGRPRWLRPNADDIARASALLRTNGERRG